MTLDEFEALTLYPTGRHLTREQIASVAAEVRRLRSGRDRWRNEKLAGEGPLWDRVLAAESERDSALRERDEARADAHARWQANMDLADKLATAESAGDEAREALREAIELAAEGWGYASDYFRDKWMYEERIAALRALVDDGGKGKR